MKFDAYAYLEKCGDETPPGAIRATSAIPHPSNSTNSTNSTGKGSNAENSDPADVSAAVAFAPPKTALPEPRPALRLAAVPARRAHDPETFPDGVCRFTGRPRTWTGKVVSLDDWRRLTDWERNGPAGRMFCGLCREWTALDGACRKPGCWNAG